MALSNQVQLRGGTSVEHESFTGAPREVTVDTDMWTLRVHNGIDIGGIPLVNVDTFRFTEKRLDQRIDDMENNLGGSHNHDDRYAGLWNPTIQGGLNVDNVRLSGRDVVINGRRALVGHANEGGNNLIINYDGDFPGGVSVHGTLHTSSVYVNGHRPILDNHKNGFYGFMTPDADEHDWLRTTANGIIPFKSGGYSNIGTVGWEFNEGWFNTLNTSTVNIHKNGNKSLINFSAQQNDPGFIEHFESNNSSRMVFSVSDDKTDGDQFWFGSNPGGIFTTGAIITSDGRMFLERYLETREASMTMGGRHIYFDGQRPGHAPDGSISFG